jgi:hypothetical protein
MSIQPPTPSALKDAAGISQSYASMILSDSDDPDRRRTPPKSLAIFIFRTFGWRHPSIADLTDEQIDVLEQIEPWKRAQAA